MNAIPRTNQLWTGISLRPGMFRSGVLTLMMRAFSLAAGLLISVALARTLGAEGYGTYTFAFSLAALLAVPIQLGLPTLAVREVALSVERNDLGRLRGFLRWSHRTILSLSAFIGVATIGIVWAMRARLDPEHGANADRRGRPPSDRLSESTARSCTSRRQAICTRTDP